MFSIKTAYNSASQKMRGLGVLQAFYYF